MKLERFMVELLLILRQYWIKRGLQKVAWVGLVSIAILLQNQMDHLHAG